MENNRKTMKTKPFDLEKALNGAKVVTRDGQEVTQLTKFETSKIYSLVGVLDNLLQTWTSEGIFDRQSSESDADLFLAVEPQRIWVNVYYYFDKLWMGGPQYNSLEEARLNLTNTGNMRYIKTIEITDEPDGK